MLFGLITKTICVLSFPRQHCWWAFLAVCGPCLLLTPIMLLSPTVLPKLANSAFIFTSSFGRQRGERLNNAFRFMATWCNHQAKTLCDVIFPYCVLNCIQSDLSLKWNKHSVFCATHFILKLCAGLLRKESSELEQWLYLLICPNVNMDAKLIELWSCKYGCVTWFSFSTVTQQVPSFLQFSTVKSNIITTQLLLKLCCIYDYIFGILIPSYPSTHLLCFHNKFLSYSQR